jgi:hypothetical protein
MAKQTKTTDDPEIFAISEVYAALKDLEPDARARVLDYVAGKFNIPKPAKFEKEDITPSISSNPRETNLEAEDDMEGISPAGKKWITRNGIKPTQLMSVFSLGIDEIDLVSKSVPGSTKVQRMRHVFLLKGIAAYLGTGAARFTHEQVKEACLHYNAWDGPNFASNFKNLTADVSGSKESGYNLTAKGMTDAANLVKEMIVDT